MMLTCSFEGCQVQAMRRMNLHIHFGSDYGGDKPSPPMLTRVRHVFPMEALNGRRPTTQLCNRGAENQHQRLAEEEEKSGAETGFQLYGLTLDHITPFR